MCVSSISLFDKSLSSGVAVMLLFLTFHFPIVCYNVYRFAASSLFSCCPIILYIIFAYYSCVDGTEIKDTNQLTRLIHTSIVFIAVVCESARF